MSHHSTLTTVAKLNVQCVVTEYIIVHDTLTKTHKPLHTRMLYEIHYKAYWIIYST